MIDASLCNNPTSPEQHEELSSLTTPASTSATSSPNNSTPTNTAFQRCQRCLNHGDVSIRKNHVCPYKNRYHTEVCPKCQLIALRQVVNRQINEKFERDQLIDIEGVDEPLPVEKEGRFARDPKCVQCQVHGEINSLRGHKRKCKYRNCDCQTCGLVAKRRTVMAAQVKLRRRQALKLPEAGDFIINSEIMAAEASHRSNELIKSAMLDQRPHCERLAESDSGTPESEPHSGRPHEIFFRPVPPGLCLPLIQDNSPYKPYYFDTVPAQADFAQPPPKSTHVMPDDVERYCFMLESLTSRLRAENIRKLYKLSRVRSMAPKDANSEQNTKTSKEAETGPNSTQSGPSRPACNAPSLLDFCNNLTPHDASMMLHLLHARQQAGLIPPRPPLGFALANYGHLPCVVRFPHPSFMCDGGGHSF